MMSNPPYGKSWGTEVKNMTANGTANKKDITDDRFVKPGYADDPDYAMLPDTGDGQMLFLLNMVNKMKTDELGSRIATVHNGSSLFTGNAGQGESNARRYLLENDLVEAIIQLPEKIFYNTGIATYIWLLTNRKKEAMRGKVQLIDASKWSRPLRKNLGERNCEMAPEDRARVLDLILNPRNTENSIVLSNEELGYRSIIVERPLRLSAEISAERLAQLKDQLPEKQRDAIMSALSALPEGAMSWVALEKSLKGIKLTKKISDELRKALGVKAADAPVLGTDKSGYPIADAELRETEQIPLTESVTDFMEREVMPYAPDSFVPEPDGKIGYEISFNRYFYKPAPLRSIADIIADIRALDAGSDAILNSIIAESVTKGLNPDVPLKESSSEWLGQVPKHWELDLLKKFCSPVKYKNSSLDSDTALQFRYGEIIEKSNIDKTDAEYMKTIAEYTVIHPNNIIINGLNMNYDFVSQRVAISTLEGVITSAYLALDINQSILPKYLTYQLKSFDTQKLFHGLGKGIRLTLTYKILSRILIAVPPSEEQKEIVNYLDKKCAKIDELISRHEQTIEKLKELKTATIAHVVTGKMDVRDAI